MKPDKPLDAQQSSPVDGKSAERTPNPVLLVCRSLANFHGGPRPAGDVTRACKICAEPVSLTERGQEQERTSETIVLCNPCALVIASALKQGGNQIALRHNPEAINSLASSQAARNMHELFEKLVKP